MFLTSEIDCLGHTCEVARFNFKTSQGKMKARYDNHVIDRKFKPGDKVLALLPIPGRPLQAKYFGPYTIDKKTSDLNYTTQNLLRITFSFDLMLKTNRPKKYYFYKDRLIFGLDDHVANMSIRHVYYA